MLMESFVAVMALIAACALTPGVYFAINAPAGAIGTDGGERGARRSRSGASRSTPRRCDALAQQVGETSLLSRTGGAPSLAVGMAHLFSNALGGSGAMALWYHFAIMFEALFILTTLDAGTRVGRFMLQDLGKHVWEPFGRVSWYPAVVIVERAVRRDVGPLPLSGRDRSARRHQLALAAVRHLEPAARRGRAVRRHDGHHQDGQGALRVGHAAAARVARHRDDDGRLAEDLLARSRSSASSRTRSCSSGQVASGTLPAAIKTRGDAQRMIFNDYLDAAVAAFFMISVVVILADSMREWTAVLARPQARYVHARCRSSARVAVAGD